MIIAHSLLGDHRGYGRLWNTALHQSDVYALRHPGLAGGDVFALDREGAVRMASKHARTLEATFASLPFDLIGASFGGVLASHVAHVARANGGCPRRLVLIDPPPAVPSELPVPKMLTSLRTAAMGVLLIYLRIEMGASVWEQFPQLQTLPESALGYFVAAQCLPAGSSKGALVEWAEWCLLLLAVYRQCRHSFHMLSSGIEAFGSHSDDSPAALMVLSSERWPTFREMFPGVKDDILERYGPATTLQLPGMHIAMINRCLSNSDAAFTGGVERYVSEVEPLLSCLDAPLPLTSVLRMHFRVPQVFARQLCGCVVVVRVRAN